MESASQLLESDCFDFFQKTNISTGEILTTEPVEAKHHGLTFRLSPSVKDAGLWLIVRGSLHRFYNDGGTNGNDFYYWQFKEALNKLETLLNIPIQDFAIRNIEFGVNLSTELTAAKYIRSLIYDGNKAFADLNINDCYVGKQCTRQDTTLKIYDKGKQESKGDKRLLRIELKFNRMRLLIDSNGRFNIGLVRDLLSREKVGVLGQELALRWSQIIFYDGGIDKKEGEKVGLWKYRSPQYWQELNRKQRYKAKQKFNKIISELCSNQTQKDIEKMILIKWADLVNMKHKERGRLTQKNDESEAPKKGTFDTIQCIRLLSPIPPKNENEKNQENFIKNPSSKKRFCVVCGADISHRKKSALTCSRKCRNKKSNLSRKERISETRKIENENLIKVMDMIEAAPVKVYVLKINNKRSSSIFTNQIKPMKYKERRKITRVRGSCGGLPFEFTTMRAKEFIRKCITLNYNQYEG